MKRIKQYNTKARGFTLLFAVLISSLLLAVGLAIFNITIKELTISSAGRESHFAFYAADSGSECALYSDVVLNAFPTNTPSSIHCNGKDYAVGGSYVSTFRLDFTPENYCAEVTVTKSVTGSTTIESRGYNTCDPENPRRVERAIRVTY